MLKPAVVDAPKPEALRVRTAFDTLFFVNTLEVLISLVSAVIVAVGVVLSVVPFQVRPKTAAPYLLTRPIYQQDRA